MSLSDMPRSCSLLTPTTFCRSRSSTFDRIAVRVAGFMSRNLPVAIAAWIEV